MTANETSPTSMKPGERIDYQPIIDLKKERICGAETLIRWHSPELGFVAPDKFIPILEENGLIEKVGNWVLESTCHLSTLSLISYAYIVCDLGIVLDVFETFTL